MAGNKGRGKVLTKAQADELSAAVESATINTSANESGGRHVHTRGITMSSRQGRGRGKGGGKRLRSEVANCNIDDDTLMDNDPPQEEVGCHDTPGNMDTNPSHDIGITSDSYGESLGMDMNTEASEPPPSFRTVHINKDSCGRFVSSTSSVSCVSKKKDSSWMLKQAMPGGPLEISLLKSYCGHVAVDIWQGKSRGVLVGYNRATHCQNLVTWKNKMNEEVVKLDDGAGDGLSFLADCLFDHLDMPLQSAFVERWQPDTNTFHLPFGEMTITLHDVFHILRIPVDGRLVHCEDQSLGVLLVDVASLLQKTPEEMREQGVYKHGGVLTEKIIEACYKEAPTQKHPPQVEASGFLLALLGTTLFTDKTKTRVNPLLYNLVKNLDEVHSYSWGSATLAYLYRQLGIASRAKCKSLSGCLSLLQAWIYEYFHKFRPQRAQLTIDSNMPRVLAWDVKLENKHNIRLETFRKLLDDYTPDQVTWLPFGPNQGDKVPRTLYEGYIQYFDIIEPYMPDRVRRQLGYKQLIPGSPFGYDEANRSASPHQYALKNYDGFMILWDRFQQLLLHESMRVSDPSIAVTEDYIDWYMRVSHPYLLPEVQNAPVPRPPDGSCGEWYWERHVEMSMEWFEWDMDEVDATKLRELNKKQREHMAKYLKSRGIIPSRRST